MIKERIFDADVNQILVQPNRDRGLLRAIGNALWERPSVRTPPQTRGQFADMIEATPDFVFTADKRGNLLYCNRAALEVLGIEERERVGTLNLTDIYSADSRTRVLGEGIFAAILDGSWSGEAILVSRTGREVPVSLVIVAPLSADERSEFLSIVARDIAEKKREEAALVERERFFRRLVEAADIGIGFVDPENRVGYANPKAARLLGYPAEELIGMPMVNLICHEASANERDHSEVTGRGERASHTVRLRRKDGAVVSARASTTPLFDEQEQLIGILALVAEAVEERSEKANPSRKSEGFLFVARKLRSGLPETCTCLWSILSLE